MSRSHIRWKGRAPFIHGVPGFGSLLPLLFSLFISCGTKQDPDNGSASRFQLEDRPWGKMLMVHTGEEQRDTLRYRLIRKEEKAPERKGEVEGDLRVPVERIACLSSTHVGMLKALDSKERIAAFTSRDHLFDAELREAMEKGRVESIGSEGRVDLERVIDSGCELVLRDGMNRAGRGRKERMEAAGISVLPVLEWKEADPIQRLEWIRVFGVLVGKEARADSVYRSRRSRYRDIAGKMQSLNERPKVLCNALHKGTWYIPGGKSYMVRLIRDAGGAHPWKDESTGGVGRDLEEVMAGAGDADVWLNPGAANSLAQLKEQDQRLGRIEAFRKGRVFNNDGRKKSGGGNDYWESGVARPDLVLADIAHILHPERFSEHELFYHRELPEREKE